MKALFLVVMVITGYSTIAQTQKNITTTPILAYGDPITLQQADHDSGHSRIYQQWLDNGSSNC